MQRERTEAMRPVSSGKVPTPSLGRIVLVSAGCTVAGLLLRFAFNGVLGEEVPYVTFFPAVAVAAWFGGMRAGLPTVLLSAVVSAYFVIPPIGAFAIRNSAAAAGLIAFVILGAFVSFVCDAMVKQRDRAAAAEQNEREQRALWQQTLASIGDAVIATGKSGQITFVNKAAEQLTGWTLAEAVDRPLTEVFRIVNEHTGAAAENPIDRVLQQGIVVGLANHTKLIRKDGTEVPIEDSAAPVRDATGVITGAVLVFRDVSDRRSSEIEREHLLDELRKSEALLDSLFEQAPVGLGFWNLDLRYSRVNSALAEINGLPKEAHYGKTVAELLPGITPEVTEAFRTVRDSGIVVAHETTGETPKFPGQPRTWSVTYYPVGSPDNPVGVGAICIDVTEARQARLAIARANDDLRQFAYAVSHDLQEPLRMVLAYTQLLEKRFGDSLGEDGREFIRYAGDGARRMNSLLQALRDYWVAGAQESEPAHSMSSEDAFRTALVNLGQMIDESGAIVEHTPLPPVCAHSVPLVQVFQNLIGNAIKYAGKDTPRVRVCSDPDGTNWRFSVEDNGIGIDDEFLDDVFLPFKRLHPGERSGTGIGLSLCRKIVERYGGRIWVESRQGHGSTFFFTLPAAASTQSTSG